MIHMILQLIRWNGYVYGFSLDDNTIDISDIVDILKYTIKNDVNVWIHEIFLLCFVRSIATKYISLNNEPCLAIDLNSDENNKRLWHCPFMVR